MPSVPGLPADVYFGNTQKPLPDWRESASNDESDDDMPSEDDLKAVIAMLGFDPRLPS